MSLSPKRHAQMLPTNLQGFRKSESHETLKRPRQSLTHSSVFRPPGYDEKRRKTLTHVELIEPKLTAPLVSTDTLTDERIEGAIEEKALEKVEITRDEMEVENDTLQVEPVKIEAPKPIQRPVPIHSVKVDIPIESSVKDTIQKSYSSSEKAIDKPEVHKTEIHAQKPIQLVNPTINAPAPSRHDKENSPMSAGSFELDDTPSPKIQPPRPQIVTNQASLITPESPIFEELQGVVQRNSSLVANLAKAMLSVATKPLDKTSETDLREILSPVIGNVADEQALEKLESELKKAKTQITTLESSLEQAHTQQKTLQSQHSESLNALQQELNQTKSHQQDILKKYEEQVNELQKQIVTLQEEASRQAQKSNQEIDLEKKKLAELQGTLKTVLSRIEDDLTTASLEVKIENIPLLVKASEKNIVQLTKDIEKVKKRAEEGERHAIEVQKLQSEITTLKEKLATVTKQHEELKSQFDQNKETITKLEAEKKEQLKSISSLKKQVEQLEKEKANSQKSIDEVTKKLKDTESEQKQQLEMVRKALKDANAKLQTTEAQLKDKEAQSTQLQKEGQTRVDHLQQQLIDGIKKVEEKSKIEIANRDKEIGELKTTIGQLESSIKTKDKQLTDVNKKLEFAGNKSEEITHLTQSIATLEQGKIEMEGKISELENSLGQAIQTNASLQAAKQKAEEEVFSIQTQLKQTLEQNVKLSLKIEGLESMQREVETVKKEVKVQVTPQEEGKVDERKLVLFTGFKDKIPHFTSADKTALMDMVKKLPSAQITDDDTTCTHVICPPDTSTSKSCAGYLRKCWIITNPHWISQSFRNGHWLPPDNFGTRGQGSDFLHGKYVALSQKLRGSTQIASDLIRLVEIAGGIMKEVDKPGKLDYLVCHKDEILGTEYRGRATHTCSNQQFSRLMRGMPSSPSGSH